MSAAGGEARRVANSVLTCALAYNLVFFVQELFLALPKALTPGLHPTLFHNNHTWTGDHPLVPLLQGSGALATILAGGLCVAWLSRRPPRAEGWRLLLLWMAVMGFFEALPQIVIGSLIPQNDVGMALGFLGLSLPQKAFMSGLAVIALAAVGGWAAPQFAALGPGARPIAGRALLPLAVLPALAAPFRVPGALIEVFFPPVVDAATALLAIAAWCWRAAPPDAPQAAPTRPWKPLAALLALLAVFQLVLRPGIHLG